MVLPGSGSRLWKMKILLLSAPTRESIMQLYRYGLVGGSTNLVGYILYLFLTYNGGDPKSTMTILYGLGVAVSFYGNRKFTFAHKNQSYETAIKYCIVYGAGYILNLLILVVLVDYFGFPHQLIQFIAIFIVALFLFVTSKNFVFT